MTQSDAAALVAGCLVGIVLGIIGHDIVAGTDAGGRAAEQQILLNCPRVRPLFVDGEAFVLEHPECRGWAGGDTLAMRRR